MHYDVIKYLTVKSDKIRLVTIGICFLGMVNPGIGAYSQTNESIPFRHVKGIQGVEVCAGISDLGVSGSLYYSLCFTHKWFGKTGITYEFKNDSRFKTTALTGDILCARTMIFKKQLFTSVLAGGSVVISETLKGIKTEHDLSTTGIGFAGGIELEYFLLHRFSLVADGLTRYIINSDIGHERYYLEAGLKYSF